VIARLNRGSKDGSTSTQAQQYFVIPVGVAKTLPRTEGWGKVSFSKFPELQTYLARWDLIRDTLGM